MARPQEGITIVHDVRESMIALNFRASESIGIYPSGDCD
jgi:hypothetical protein